jgi:hypothetical protein
MTGLVQSARSVEASEPDLVNGGPEEMPPDVQAGDGPRRPTGIGGWRGVAWLGAAAASVLVIAWSIFLTPGETGSKAQWFFGAVVFAVVLVSLWQTRNIQRLAKQNVDEASATLRRELAAAEERSARELALVRKLHLAELEAQRELARTERIHQRNQLQKQAIIEVSRAVGAHTHMLATLWNEGANILTLEDRSERADAMRPVFEQISAVVNDFSVELDSAHLLIDDDRLNHALERVNEAALMAIQVAQDVHGAVVDGREPQPNPVPGVQRLMHTRAAEARRLAWDLLRTTLADRAPST